MRTPKNAAEEATQMIKNIAIYNLQNRVCKHIDYRDTLDGAVCNNCGKEINE